MRRLLLLLTILLFGSAAPASAHPEHEQAAAAGNGAVAGDPTARGDRLAWGVGDRQGYHVYFARGEEGWAWRSLATIRPLRFSEDSWVGYQCLTGDGRYVVAVIAPRLAANIPAARDRGGLAYVVRVADGRVRPLARNISVKYHTPGCGRDDHVVLSRNLGRDQETTELIVADASRARLVRHARIDGQVTSAIPVGRRIWAAGARGIVDVTSGRPRLLHRVQGTAYSLRPAAAGADYLVAAGARGRVERVTGWHRSHVLGHGAVANLALFGGRDGRNVAVGVQRWRARPAGLRSIAAPRRTVVQGASIDGHVALGFPMRLATARRSATDGPSMAADGGATLAPVVTDSVGRRIARPELSEPIGRAFVQVPAAVVPGAQASRLDAVTPKCAVPRNDLRRQVPQPNAAQVNWAIQQATRNALKGTVLTRPSNYANMGLAAYQPSLDFSRGTLAGNASAAVPPQVIFAIYAQESAWHQASFRALAGVSGNPLVGDYYGALGTLDRIEYNDADCGYGISQVTDAMTVSSPLYSANGKAKVAVDYAENVAAGIQVMVDKWNQLAAAGLKMNNGDPQYLENWYFAIWAYNSGFYPNSGTGPWGLGWTNNPRNADYPPNRGVFLKGTYADAEHPNDWPYQERILGWMQTAMLDYKGKPAYRSSDPITQPGINLFCSTAATIGNDCDPNYLNGSMSYCTRSDRKCWWHTSVAPLPCPTGCNTGTFTVDVAATEPPGDNNYPPACSSTLPSSTVIVDEQPSNLNVEGCGASNWSSQGSFSTSYGTNSSGVALGQIDWHQLGTGFGGHTWFTKNRGATDTAHINIGTWTPPTLSGIYTVKAHIPASGASTSAARYTIYRGDGTSSVRVINQHLHENRWVSLGTYTLQAGAKVVLTNFTAEAPGTANVAYDAMAFYKVTGTPVSATFDATTTFDDNTNLDASNWMTGVVTKPLDSHQHAWEWAMDTTAPTSALNACSGTVRDQSCVGPATRTAVMNWRYRVTRAGSQWVSNPLDTLPSWMGYSSPDPPQTLSQTFLSTKTNFKVRGRLLVDFRTSAGLIDLNSVTVQAQTATGNTHLPPWAPAFMRAVRDDYGVALPDLRYTAVDLNDWNHAAVTVDPLANDETAGRAYRPKVSEAQLTDGGQCVRVKQITGGAIGLKPMVKSQAVERAAYDWKLRVQSVVTAGRAPAAVSKVADELYRVLFSPPHLTGVLPDVNSPFHFAPPIWVQQDARFCADGTVKPGVAGGQIADSGYMPDLYLYVNNQPVGMAGQALASGPAQTGQFANFSKPPTLPTSTPWNDCNTAPGTLNFVNRRDGSPWDLEFDTSADQTADQVRFCDEVPGAPPIHDLP